jgi:hypothetical protein
MAIHNIILINSIIQSFRWSTSGLKSEDETSEDETGTTSGLKRGGEAGSSSFQ